MLKTKSSQPIVNRGETLLRKRAVCERTGLPPASLHERIVAGRFPKPVLIGARAVAWVESEVQAWIEQRIAERDSERAA
jgi:prophage regulatory protein